MKLKHSVAANFIAQGWAVIIGLAFIPIYIRYLGIEVYGLIGFFVAIQAWVVILDLGLSVTVNRAMARYSEVAQDSIVVRRLLRSAERIYGAAGAVIIVLIVAAAPYLASHWFQAKTLSQADTEQAVCFLGVAVVMRWAAQIYRSAILGLQRQVWLAWFTVVITTVRSVGATVILVAWQGSVVE